MPSAASAARLVHRVWTELGRDAAELEALEALPEVPLPARLDVSALAVGSVAAASLVAATVGAGADAASSTAVRPVPARPVRLDGDRIATAFTSERWFRVAGEAPDVWAPLSGFRRAADGWVRTHANYPWHADALRRALGVADGADAGMIDAAIAERTAADLEAAVTAAGGLCVAVRTEDPADDGDRRRHPLIELVETDAGTRAPLRMGDSRRPLAGVRVLDLTRVIAGPVATRTLALLGADVLRIDPPRLREPEWQQLDSGAGKRSALLDLADRNGRGGRERFDRLLAEADVVVVGYRPSAMRALGLDPVDLVEANPRLVVGQLSAWGFDEAAAERRGFDSMVQAASGIAWIEAGEGAQERGAKPRALPAQALDHATGYLLAAGVVSMLSAAGRTGARVARVSLRRTAAELLGLERAEEVLPRSGLSADAAERHLESFGTGRSAVRVTRPAIAYEGGPGRWPTGPRPWGRDQPRWAE